MVTLKDFLDLDFCICGIDIDLRAPSKLVERHIIGLSGWAGAHWNYCGEAAENIAVYSDNTNSKVYIHNKPLNFHQTDKPYRGPCRPWGVEYDTIPKAFLHLTKQRLVLIAHRSLLMALLLMATISFTRPLSTIPTHPIVQVRQVLITLYVLTTILMVCPLS